MLAPQLYAKHMPENISGHKCLRVNFFAKMRGIFATAKCPKSGNFVSEFGINCVGDRP
jgi:hypothetical protein